MASLFVRLSLLFAVVLFLVLFISTPIVAYDDDDGEIEILYNFSSDDTGRSTSHSARKGDHRASKESKGERQRERHEKEPSRASSFDAAAPSAHSFSGSAWNYFFAEMKRLGVRFEDPRDVYSFEERDSDSLGYGLYGRVFSATKDGRTVALSHLTDYPVLLSWH